jgi:hypothetical protein
MVERMIGSLRGTGGSAGVSYLQSTLPKRAFPDLWRVRTRLGQDAGRHDPGPLTTRGDPVSPAAFERREAAPEWRLDDGGFQGGAHCRREMNNDVPPLR